MKILPFLEVSHAAQWVGGSGWVVVENEAKPAGDPVTLAAWHSVSDGQPKVFETQTDATKAALCYVAQRLAEAQADAKDSRKQVDEALKRASPYLGEAMAQREYYETLTLAWQCIKSRFEGDIIRKGGKI